MANRDGRMPTSARRYTATSRLQPANNAARLTHDIYADVDYNPVPKRGGNTYVQDTPSLPRPRPNTTQDRAITTRVNPLKPQLQPAQQPRRIGRRGMIFGGLGLVVGTLIAGDWALNTWNNVSLVMAQGPVPSRNLELRCGHGGDSRDHPTLLHAFIADYTLHVIEYPAGKNVGTHGETCLGLPTTGDVSKWVLGMEAQKVEGSYQVFITLQIPGESLLHEWILVDSGKGYFAMANPK